MATVARLYLGGDTGATPETIAEQVSSVFEGATITPGIGLWQGSSEPTFVIEILGASTADALRLARMLRVRFRQDAILLTFIDGVRRSLITD